MAANSKIEWCDRRGDAQHASESDHPRNEKEDAE